MPCYRWRRSRQPALRTNHLSRYRDTRQLHHRLVDCILLDNLQLDSQIMSTTNQVSFLFTWLRFTMLSRRILSAELPVCSSDRSQSTHHVLSGMSLSVRWTFLLPVNSGDFGYRNRTYAMEDAGSGESYSLFHLAEKMALCWKDMLVPCRNFCTTCNVSHWLPVREHITLILSSFHCFDAWSTWKNSRCFWPSPDWIRTTSMVCNYVTMSFAICHDWTSSTSASRQRSSKARVISFSRPATISSAVSWEDHLDQSVHKSMYLQKRVAVVLTCIRCHTTSTVDVTSTLFRTNSQTFRFHPTRSGMALSKRSELCVQRMFVHLSKSSFESSRKASRCWEACTYATTCHKQAKNKQGQWSHSLDCVVSISVWPMWTTRRIFSAMNTVNCLVCTNFESAGHHCCPWRTISPTLRLVSLAVEWSLFGCVNHLFVPNIFTSTSRRCNYSYCWWWWCCCWRWWWWWWA